eukprot:COSAG01_NODE_2196_length_8179_cov_17.030322_3_plen_134_part_00
MCVQVSRRVCVRERVRVCMCVAGQSGSAVETPRHRSSTPKVASAQGPASDVSSVQPTTQARLGICHILSVGTMQCWEWRLQRFIRRGGASSGSSGETRSSPQADRNIILITQATREQEGTRNRGSTAGTQAFV